MHFPDVNATGQALYGDGEHQLGGGGVSGHQFAGDGEQLHAGDVQRGIGELEEVGAGIGKYFYVG